MAVHHELREEGGGGPGDLRGGPGELVRHAWGEGTELSGGGSSFGGPRERSTHRAIPLPSLSQAIWDALGKHRKKPVYELLGGKTKERMPCYATTSRPDLARDMGFWGAKFPLPYGPASGERGMR